MISEADELIVQIIPAPLGWRILYVEEDGSATYADLVGWALQRNGDIFPFGMDRDGYMDYEPRRSVNFVGTFGPSEEHTPARTLQLIDEWKAEQAKRKPKALP